MNNPQPKKKKKARLKAGLTQSASAKLIYCGDRAWRQWEAGDRQMSLANWELFLIKTGLNI